MTTQQQRKLRGKKLEIYKQSLQLTDLQREVLIGTLLGDSSMSLREGKPCYSIKFEQGEAHAEYVTHLYEIFEPFTGTSPKWRWIDSEHKRRALWFRTYRHDSLIFYYNLFYEGEGEHRRKIVPKNIAKFLTPRVMAYWFMDDGNQTSDKLTYCINTQGFKQHESQMLCNVLKEKYNITASLNKDKDSWRIYIWRESAVSFRTLVEPYVLSCFHYRLITASF
jgi:hypothetical protein